MNKITGKKRHKIKNSIRKLKHMQSKYGFDKSREDKINHMNNLLKIQEND